MVAGLFGHSVSCDEAGGCLLVTLEARGAI